MLETKERLKAENNLRKEEDAKTAAVADADTAMEARQKAEDSLAKKTTELQKVNSELNKHKSNSLAQQKAESMSQQKL